MSTARPPDGTVALPMYDLKEIRPATEGWLMAIAERLAQAGMHPALPMHPLHEPRNRWLLVQTCGYPLTHGCAGWFHVVATPRYAAEGCDGAGYRSAIVVREDHPARTLRQLRGTVAAVNDWQSHSGMNALRHAVAGHAKDGRFFAEVKRTGAHRASLAAVRERAADIAAIDCVTWALLRTHAPAETEGIRVLAWSKPAPGLPFVTDARHDVAILEELRHALREPPPDLLIEGFDMLPLAAYDRILLMEREAAERGYPELR